MHTIQLSIKDDIYGSAHIDRILSFYQIDNLFILISFTKLNLKNSNIPDNWIFSICASSQSIFFCYNRHILQGKVTKNCNDYFYE